MGFFASFNDWLTRILDGYIHTYTHRLADILAPTFATVAAIYVLVWGFLQLAGRIEEPLLEALKRIAILALVFEVGMNFWFYDTVIVEFFFNSPTNLASRIVGGENFVDVVDAIFKAGDDVATALLAKSGIIKGFSFFLAAIVVWFWVLLTGLYTMFLLTLSRIALSVLLALGPLIIPLWMFPFTQKFVESWFQQLSLYGFVAILSGLVSAFMLHLIDESAHQALKAGGGITIVHAVRVCMAAGFTFIIMRQVMQMAAGLASGFVLSTLGIVSSSINYGRQRSWAATRQFIRGAVLDGETTRWDPLSRKAGYYLRRFVTRSRNSISH
jgi:type IV secretion system protein VirB6